MSICNEKKYANDVLRHGFISEVLPRLLGINGYVQIPTVKIKRNLPQLWYINKFYGTVKLQLDILNINYSSLV